MFITSGLELCRAKKIVIIVNSCLTTIAIGLMQFTGTLHPPSGAVALVVMMTKPDWQFLLRPTFEGSVILVLCAVIFNNLAEERTYPKHWL